MAKRNLLAPMPPGSQLAKHVNMARAIDIDKPVAVVTLTERTLSQESALQWQAQTVAYCKKRKDFFEGKVETPQQAAALTPEQTTTKLLRSPLQYLKALWKFEPERKAIVDLMYPERNARAKNTNIEGVASNVEILLDAILEPMVKLAHPEKKQYAYASAEPTKDNCCSICRYQFHKNNKKSRPDCMNEHLLHCAHISRTCALTSAFELPVDKPLKITRSLLIMFQTNIKSLTSGPCLQGCTTALSTMDGASQISSGCNILNSFISQN
ncbi:hypothetical protein EJ02DRAFT_470273 [Clathrospora elynae]|uniref:Uncharacterized protein n=1 Tax=Clathrospora elynae TaxID=706981 RepID=A0A6A5S9U0_9PLEO|nr:hypothetical protein EJ02DRAFT_470273 [Clathrospora elynae]